MKQLFAVGRVGNDAEVTYTPDGTAVAKFSVAIDNGKGKNGERKDATWIKCALWRERAEKLAPYIKKGIVVAVSGDVTARAWNDKNTNEARCQMEVNVNNFTFGGSPSGDRSESESAEDATPAAAPKPHRPAPRTAAPITDEDIPF